MIQILALWMLTMSAMAQEGAACTNPDATASFRTAFEAQKAMRTGDALEAYGRCLELEPTCVPCQYEVGWSYWSRSEWDATVAAWEKVLALDPEHASAKQWLVSAKDQGRTRPLAATGLRVPIGVESKPAGAAVKLELIGRFQNYNALPSTPGDHHDEDIYSPKSARFLPDGSRVYVNSLEGFRTVVYDPKTLKKVRVIDHTFDASHAALFGGVNTVFGYPWNRKAPSGDPNQFSGKPVESELSHGKYMWVPYYRRDFDGGATSPSAVSIIDTTTDTIVRVMPTGPIPKYVAASPDGKWVAIAHWGDNTLGVIDTSSADPKTFAYRPERLVVEKALSQKGLVGTDRDSTCGFCLRGSVFTPDSKVLLVARMGGGGVAAFDTSTWAYLGTITGEKKSPRHLVISHDGQWLYMSSNSSGYVSRIKLETALTALRKAEGGKVPVTWDGVHVGSGARTIELSPDGRWIFSAVNSRAELVVIDAATMEIAARVRTDSYAVGLAVSPDGKQVWTTSQGRKGKGGNSVCVFSVEEASP